MSSLDNLKELIINMFKSTINFREYVFDKIGLKFYNFKMHKENFEQYRRWTLHLLDNIGRDVYFSKNDEREKLRLHLYMKHESSLIELQNFLRLIKDTYTYFISCGIRDTIQTDIMTEDLQSEFLNEVGRFIKEMAEIDTVLETMLIRFICRINEPEAIKE